jgi:uncharacterized oligopeptide transporter (OPT) family protein
MLADSISNLGVMLLQFYHHSVFRGDPYQEITGELDVELLDERRALPNGSLIPRRIWLSGLVLSASICVFGVKLLFGSPVMDLILAIVFSFFASLLAVRALGETDLNPVSGIGKVGTRSFPDLRVVHSQLQISQLLFAVVSPGNTITSIIGGAIAQAGAQQAGDLMQDMKTG